MPTKRSRDLVGEFVLKDGTRSGPVSVRVDELRYGPNEPGVTDFHYRATLPIAFAGKLAVGDSDCDLYVGLERTPLVMERARLESGVVTFHRRAV
jgi:hypothetical protein